MDTINSLISGATDTSTTVNNLLSGSIDPNSTMNTLQQGGGGIFAGFTLETLIVGAIISIIGVYYLNIGRKQGKITQLLCGLALCGITYFIHNVRYLIGVSLVIAFIPILKKE